MRSFRVLLQNSTSSRAPSDDDENDSLDSASMESASREGWLST